MKGSTVISLAKARADFGAVLRLARQFGFVKIVQGNRLVGVFTDAAAVVPERPPGYFADAYSGRTAKRPSGTPGSSLPPRQSRRKLSP